ncbi:MAG TPA: DUF742 domain-containing protein [Actinophytocola sp.]|uniref:DUF742 domain-containing protein n=1 Tax=Actinophytocola sp. TaxID=1872138 RepID=UPI002DDCB32B|nr:DUF742 domain-containing protein [Actinophytocola sp.]HEV2778363.1 DUF742 domain-containing protein [Actinophytocola sp.]
MNTTDDEWYDEEAGPLVPLYAVTGGRTRPSRYDLDLITLVVAIDPDAHARLVEPEYADVLRVCAYPLSVAEVAARLSLPLGVIKVMISDLIERRYLIFRSSWQPAAPDLDMMQKVLDGIRNL